MYPGYFKRKNIIINGIKYISIQSARHLSLVAYSSYIRMPQVTLQTKELIQVKSSNRELIVFTLDNQAPQLCKGSLLFPNDVHWEVLQSPKIFYKYADSPRKLHSLS